MGLDFDTNHRCGLGWRSISPTRVYDNFSVGTITTTAAAAAAASSEEM